MTKILLVEDDKSLREIYGVRLLAEGYDIVSAGDGEEALAMAIKERPQLIVSDVMMPKISGFDMLDILRSTTETKDIKVIMMTALSSEDQRERGEALGADRYLVKSQVGIEDVVRTVHEVLGDAPIAGAVPGAVPAQSTTPRAATPNIPQRPGAVAPTPQPQAPQVASPAPQPAVPAPSTTPQIQSAPAFPPQPAATSQPTPPAQTAPGAPQVQGSSNLPQPTAPFSTNRPAGLGDRIIHPIEQPTNKPDFSNLIAQELGESAPAPATQPSASQPVTSPATTTLATPATAPSTPAQAPPALQFEEMPLQRPAAPNFPPQPPQQPN